MKIFRCKFFYTVHSMLVLGREAKYYLMCTHVLNLCIKGCQFFRNLMCYVTHYQLYCSGLTAVIEVHKGIVYILV